MTTSPSPSSSTSYEVDSAALLKILLHGAKHPSSDVLGVLLGRPPKEASSGDGNDADASSTPSVSGRVVDALPLFHGPMLSGPMLEVALLQAAAHAKSRDLSLLGVYAANELLGDDRLKPAARAAAEAVARGSGSVGGSGGGGSGGNGNGASFGCALLVNNGALASFSEGKADPEAGDVLSLWLRKSNDCKGAGGGGWERVSPPSASSSSSSSSSPALLLRGAGGEERAKLFAQAVASGLVDRVSDFDDHLLDVKKDWLNPGLLA